MITVEWCLVCARQIWNNSCGHLPSESDWHLDTTNEARLSQFKETA